MLRGVAEKLFVCIQLELPYPLGPPDGRYVLRSGPGAAAEHVVVLRTTAARRPPRARASGRGGKLDIRPGEDVEPGEVAVAQATVIDAVALSAESQAHAWLESLDPAREMTRALAVLDRVRFAHRIAAADAAVRDLDPSHAIALRAGFGSGTQLADGRLAQVRELATPGAGAPGLLLRLVPIPGRRAEALRPDERLAALLGGRERPLVCEELVLRARADLDRGRVALAAIELDSAIDAALTELPGGPLDERVAQLRELQEPVAQAAEDALAGGAARAAAGEARAAGSGGATEPDPELIRRALGQLEAALRERASGARARRLGPLRRGGGTRA
jgi:hypothetical protein